MIIHYQHDSSWKEGTMSTLALLNADGTLYRRLRFRSFPKGFTVPIGKILSWNQKVKHYSIYCTYESFTRRYPLRAFFYVGGPAWAYVDRIRIALKSSVSKAVKGLYNACTLNITVQSTSPEDLMHLRDYILGLLEEGRSWRICNDLTQDT